MSASFHVCQLPVNDSDQQNAIDLLDGPRNVNHQVRPVAAHSDERTLLAVTDLAIQPFQISFRSNPKIY